MGKGADSGSGPASSIAFTINGKDFKVDAASDPKINTEYMLVDFIRDVAHLKGTKLMCREGGCGACVVTARYKDPGSGNEIVKAINSCITPVYSCNGWDITTVEGLGNKEEGYHVIQNRIVNFHGTQCGFCTPGMVMNMHGLMQAKKDLTVKDVENSFDGNICRCTGYRPILDAFKSLAVDAPEDLKRKCADIEDCASCPCPMRKDQKGKQGNCQEKCNVALTLANGSEWVTAVDLWTVFQAVQKFDQEKKRYRFVAGNTSTGVYKHDGPFNAYIEITGVPELRQTKVDGNGISLGGGVTLTEAINYLNKSSVESGFEYATRVSTHLGRVANVPVRNNASIAGNLMIKHTHREFPSDVFVLLESLGAKITLGSGVANTTTVTMLEFLATNMKGKLILSILLPKLDEDTFHFRSFKITRRYQNAHAYVNAGLLFQVDRSARKLLGKPRLVFGGINAEFVHATNTEAFLEKNPDISNQKTLQDALNVMEKEVNPDVKPPEADPEYRRALAKSLVYKTILEIMGTYAGQKFKTGAIDIPRGISSGKQVYESDKSDLSLYKDVPKLEAAWQASGEAEYIPDIPQRPDELTGVFVQSTIPCGKIKSIDASEALKIPGVVRFVSAKDVRGVNNCMAYFFFPTTMVEPVFTDDTVHYNGQSIGLIVATTRAIAVEAAKKVKVEYSDIDKPVVDMKEALEKVEKEGNIAKHIMGTFTSNSDPTVKITRTIKGELRTGGQYQGHMETQNCLSVPNEDGMDLFSSTQWMDHTQITVAKVLGVPTNSINIQVKRVGGGFGAKIVRSSHIAAACAVAAQAVRKPVRVMLDLETNMSLLGKRLPYIMRYEVGFDDNGKIGSLKAELFCDPGFSPNDACALFAVVHMQSAYKALGWEVKPGFVLTNTPANTACRAPGSVNGMALIENIMEHIAHELKKDPLAVREVNFLQRGEEFLPTPFGGGCLENENLIPSLINEAKASGDYEARKAFIESFNFQNRWKKRGMSLVPVRYPVDYTFGCNLPATIAIYHYDGTVACSHAGVEMGQGLNTKVVQTIAQAFQIPMDRIKIKPTNNFVGANAFPSGGSVASELCCYAALRACEIIKERMKPVLEKMENPSWEKLIEAAYQAKIDLTASWMPTPMDGLKGYQVWALALTEVEIDVLTGEYKVVRTDLIEDAGKSLSPGVDIGQIEGGYIFGQGMWTTERLEYSTETGQLLTNRTWDYKLPETKDIPEDFRITLLKNAPNPTGILRSKATGEPILCASVSVFFALKNAISAARKDKGNTDWFQIAAPITPEDVYRNCLTEQSDLSLQ